MKKIISLLFLLVIGVSVYAQQTKSYVTVYANQNNTNSAKLSGDIPSGIESSYSSSDFNSYGSNGYAWIGNVLNLLAEKGFTVESVNTVCHENTNYIYSTYLLSKPYSSASKIERVTADGNDDSEVTEVARYNLQGIPVTSSEKGVQIIVYSNYTTKTVIVE